MTDYTDTMRRWATDTRRAGLIADADGTGEIGLESAVAGQRLAVRFTLKLERDRAHEVRYQVFGCGFTMAACAAAAELAEDHTLSEIGAIEPRWVDAVLAGLPQERGYCAELAVQALQAAVKSARNDRRPVAAVAPQEPEHGPLVSADHPLYRTLISSPNPQGVSADDRHLFACLLAVAGDEPSPLGAALGLSAADLAALLAMFFPEVAAAQLQKQLKNTECPPEVSAEIRAILLSYVPDDVPPAAVLLARILAARAAHPGHLWVAMGLFERPQLSAAIRRHLPALAAANNRNMRWKRFLYKQVCDLNGGVMCKSPNCGVCSDYALCFADADE